MDSLFLYCKDCRYFERPHGIVERENTDQITGKCTYIAGLKENFGVQEYDFCSRGVKNE